MYPYTLPLTLVDDLLVASSLADEVEQLTQSLGVLRWHDVSGLTSEMLAVLYSANVLINVPASEARGHLDRLSELLTDAIEVVHKAQEVSLLRSVGCVVFSEARGRLASRQLLEGEILAHSLFCFCDVTDFVQRLCQLLCQLLRLLSAVLYRGGVVTWHVFPHAPALGGYCPDTPKDREVREFGDG